MAERLIERLRERARIRRQIPTRKSVQEGTPDRISDLLEEAADALQALSSRSAALEEADLVIIEEAYPLVGDYEADAHTWPLRWEAVKVDLCALAQGEQNADTRAAMRRHEEDVKRAYADEPATLDREGWVRVPRLETEQMQDAARGILQAIRCNPGVTEHQVFEHCRLRGDSTTGLHENDTGYVTEARAAAMIYRAMLSAAPKED